MVKNYLLIAVFLICYCGFGQPQKVIDSIEKRLSYNKKSDTARISSYNRLAFYYQYVNPEIGLKYADSALALSKKFRDNHFISQAYQSYGENFLAKSENKKALEWYNKALDLSVKSKNKSDEAHYLHAIAYVHSIQGENKKAIVLETKAYNLFMEIGKKKRAGAALNSIATNYFNLADFIKAIEYQLKSLKIAEEVQDVASTAQAYENIGLIYKRMENNEKAFSYFEKSLKKYAELKDESKTINALTNYGNAKDQAGQVGEALALYNKALAIALKGNNPRLEISLRTNIAIAQYGLKNYDKAIEGFEKGRAFFTETNDLRNLSIVNQYYVEVLLEAPDAILIKEKIDPKKKYNKALELIKISMAYAQSIDDPDEKMYLEELLSKVYTQMGNHKMALNAYKNFTVLKDSLHNNQNKEAVLTKELQYESDKKQALANAEIQRQKVIKFATIGTSSVVLLSGIFLFVGFRKRQLIRQSQNEILLKAQISDTELKALRLQMNPHFIFNSLNSIGDYIQKNDIQKADYYLAKFAKLMRGILENSEEKEIPLSEELKMIQLYMQLEASRLNNKFTYEINIDKNIDPEITLVPPLILQPFIENSIWHGFAEKDGFGKITIEVTKDNSMLNYIVEDDGVGRNNAVKSNGKSYGMKITKDRIDLLNKLKNTHAAVNLIDLEKGTRVEVHLPLEEDL